MLYLKITCIMKKFFFNEQNYAWLQDKAQMYDAAIIISFIAALARVIYSHDINSLKGFFQQWFISLFVALLVLHYLIWKDVDPNLSIVVEGAAAFIAREVLALMVQCFKRFHPMIEVLTGVKK